MAYDHTDTNLVARRRHRIESQLDLGTRVTRMLQALRQTWHYIVS